MKYQENLARPLLNFNIHYTGCFQLASPFSIFSTKKKIYFFCGFPVVRWHISTEQGGAAPVKNTLYYLQYQLILVTTSSGVFFQAGAPFITENGQFWVILAIFGYFVKNLRTFWCPFYRPIQCGGAQKLTNIRFGMKTLNRQWTSRRSRKISKEEFAEFAMSSWP